MHFKDDKNTACDEIKLYIHLVIISKLQHFNQPENNSPLYTTS